MSFNLMVRNDNQFPDTDEVNWNAIKSVAKNDSGSVTIDDKTVRAIARLLDGVILTSGATVCADYYNKRDKKRPVQVAPFGPALLPEDLKEDVRDLLAATDNGKLAVRLFDFMSSFGLQVRLTGTHISPANITGVNCVAEEVDITRSGDDMYQMLGLLGLGDAVVDDANEGEVSFDRFVEAVNDNGYKTDMHMRLFEFMLSGSRARATHVYWRAY